MEATHLVISIEGALAIAAAIIGGGLGIYWEFARTSAEFRAINERRNGMQAQITRIEDKLDRLSES